MSLTGLCIQNSSLIEYCIMNFKSKAALDSYLPISTKNILCEKYPRILELSYKNTKYKYAIRISLCLLLTKYKNIFFDNLYIHNII